MEQEVIPSRFKGVYERHLARNGSFYYALKRPKPLRDPLEAEERVGPSPLALYQNDLVKERSSTLRSPFVLQKHIVCNSCRWFIDIRAAEEWLSGLEGMKYFHPDKMVVEGIRNCGQIQVADISNCLSCRVSTVMEGHDKFDRWPTFLYPSVIVDREPQSEPIDENAPLTLEEAWDDLFSYLESTPEIDDGDYLLHWRRLVVGAMVVLG
jgi:hypothetical protein